MNQQLIDTTASATPSQPVDARAALQAGFVRIRPQIQAVLPSHISVEKFERVALTAFNNNPDLLAADRRSFFNSCQKAAQDGLLPDGREGALVIFKDKSGKQLVQWMPMVFGIIKKIRQSGEVSSITAHIVYEKEIADGMFSYVLGDDERIEHRRYLGTDRGKPALVYATCKFKDGGVEREVLTISDVEKARAVSRTGKSEYGPWAKWWDEMARKTAIRKLSKRLPLSADDRRVIESDDDSDFGRQKNAAKDDLLQQAAAQISAPAAPALTHEPDDVEVIEVPQGDVLDHVDADTGEIIDAGTAAESAATLARLLAVMPELTDVGELARWKSECKNEIGSLTDADRGEFNTAFIKREKAVKK